MPLQFERPDYDPAAINEIVNKTLNKQRKILSLVRKHRKAKSAKAAAKVYKEIKLLVVTVW
jgi:hypothetical protein